ncbi:MAG: penicillin-binding protein 1A [Desulfovibrio sp.]|uniref:penicillin-binding protein 1A n=1 Tax=Desulfovibrio sp. 7SRBS1 TaxID=3378064 RepID=UPI003B3EDD12
MKKFFIGSIIVFSVLALLGVGGAVGLYMWASKDLPGFKNITDYKPALVTTVYTRDGDVLGYFYRQKRFLVKLADMPDYLPKAFLAAEDAQFYRHDGVDPMAIFRAMLKNMKSGHIKQGGSTITQQVIKRLLLTPEKSYKRKIKEAILAYRLELYLTKAEILTIYLNQIYLGAGAYGVEAASRTYFGKHVQDLTLAESAIIAGLLPAPSRYDPYKHMEAALIRQRYVLGQMVECGWITPEQEKAALDEKIVLKSIADPSWQNGPYYLEEVRRWAVEKYGEDTVYEGGLHIYTPCDLHHQVAAEGALKRGLEESTRRRGWHGPLETLTRDQYDTFLTEEAVSEGSLAPGEWFKVLVTEVNKLGAKVRIGTYKGYISVATMHWCRTPDIKKATDEVPSIKDATLVVKPGDVVWAEVAEEPHSDKDHPDVWQLKLQQRPIVEGAIVSMEPDSGNVVALSGGYSFARSQFNRATQAKRQPGSAFKPIVYSAAFDSGLTPATVMLDAPIVYTDYSTDKVWKPENFENVFYGPTILRTALVKSRNLVTIRVAQKIGLDKIIERGQALGLKAEFRKDLSMALGSAEVTLLNLCQAYSAFARGGTIVEPRLILRVTSAWGDELFNSEPEVKDAISPQTAYIMAGLMKQVVQDGTGWRARVLQRPVAGKTGTSNDERDAWFMGYTPYLLTGVYVGFDDHRAMGKWETGSRAASSIWVDYRKLVEAEYPSQDFPQPSGITMVRIDGKNGLLAGPNTEESYFLPFKTGTEPTEVSTGASSLEGEKTQGEDLFKQIF